MSRPMSAEKSAAARDADAAEVDDAVEEWISENFQRLQTDGTVSIQTFRTFVRAQIPAAADKRSRVAFDLIMLSTLSSFDHADLQQDSFRQSLYRIAQETKPDTTERSRTTTATLTIFRARQIRSRASRSRKLPSGGRVRCWDPRRGHERSSLCGSIAPATRRLPRSRGWSRGQAPTRKMKRG